jgi:hypothetical protein
VSSLGGSRPVSRRQIGLSLSLAVVVIVYSWFSTGFRAFTIPIDIAVGAPVLAVLGLSWQRSRLGRVPPELLYRPPRSGWAVWAALTAVLTGWELAAYIASPRHAHPTLSSISDDITSGHPARAFVFALWLLLGWGLFLRNPSRDTSGG